MQPFFEISQIFLTTFFLALFMPIFWIVLFLVFLQYKRQAATEEKLFGRIINGVGKQMFFSVTLGALGGLVASTVLIFMGLSLEQIGLYFIWPVALLLLLVNPRYLCFSYAGGIVAAMVLAARHFFVPLFPALAENMVFESLLRVHIPALLVLIGLLHLVEALLIYLGGHWGKSPIYLKQGSGKVVGAFSLQRFWPLPLVALLVTIVAQTETIGVSMPEWWPILQSALQPGEGQSLQYMVIPVAAGLGYADIALSSTPRERAAFSAGWLALYSIILLAVAIGAEFLAWLALPGVIFAPLGHELLILYGKKKEENRLPRYRPLENGVPIMMVLPDTAAEEAGLQEDDLIIKINGEAVNGSMDLMQKIEVSYFLVLLEIKRDGRLFSTVLKKHVSKGKDKDDSSELGPRAGKSHSSLHRSAALGLITVPPPDSPVYVEVRKPDPLSKLRRLKQKIFKRPGV